MKPEPQTYVGPCSLREALDAATPNEEDIRMAISTPEGCMVAIELEDGPLYIRWLDSISGRTGSIMGSGRWFTETEVQEFIEGRGSWRPA